MRNPKVARLPDAQFRLWMELLCVAGENDGLIPPLDDLKHLLKRRLDHLSSGLKALISAGLIDALEDGYCSHDWNQRQYKSDTSTDRSRKHREKCNVAATPPDTETDTETDTTPTGVVKRTRKTRCPSDFIPDPSPGSKTAERMAQWGADRLTEQIEKFIAHHQAKETRYSDWQQAWTNWALSDFDGKNGNGRQTYQAGKRNGIADALDREIGFGEPAGTPERRAIRASGTDGIRAIAGPAAG